MTASGSITAAGLFDLKLDGTTTDLMLGIAPLDPFVAGETHVTGGIARSEEGFRFDQLALENDRATAKVTGRLSDPAIDLTVSASVADLSLATPRAKGAAEISANLTGSRDAPKVDLDATGANLVLMDRPLADARAHFSGVVAGPETSGEAAISGTLGESAVRGSASLSAGQDGTRLLDNLKFAVGESQVSGKLTIGADGLLSGDLSVVSPDLSKVAPLFLVQAAGGLRAEIALSAEGGKQSATFSGTANRIVYETVSLASAEIDGTVQDLFHAPEIEGKFSLKNSHRPAVSSSERRAARRPEAAARRRSRSMRASLTATPTSKQPSARTEKAWRSAFRALPISARGSI